MIQFKLLPHNKILVVRFLTSEDYVTPQDLLDEAQSIQVQMIEQNPAQVVFVGESCFWHKNIRIECFQSLHECMNWSKQWRGFLKFLKESSIPCYAFIQTACDSIGLELALACRFRIATSDTFLSCQDVRHGHLPVGGLLFRLISLIGLEHSLQLLLRGEELTSYEAKQLGLIHEISQWSFDDRDMALPSFSRKIPKYRFFLEDLPWARGMMFRFWRKEILARFRGHFRSPLKLLEIIERGWFKGGETRAQLEIEAFSQLVFSTQTHILEHIHSKLRSFFKVAPVSRRRILFLGVDSETLELMSLFSPYHSLCLYEESHKKIDSFFNEFESRLVFECLQNRPDYKNFDLVFKRLPEQGIVFECLSNQELTAFKMRFFSPLKVRKIVEIYQSESNVGILLSLFTGLGKFPLTIKGDDSVCHSPVIRMALSLHDEALLMVQEGHTLESILNAFRDLGMRPSVFELWKESSTDQMNAYKTKIFARYPDRFVKNIGKKSPVSRERFALRLLKESLHLLAEGLVKDPLTIDLMMIYGLGYPRYQGGLLYQVDYEGPELWLKKMEELEVIEGERFAPPDFFRKIAQTKGRIYDYTIL